MEIASLTHEGRGLAHFNGKAVFVDGALPGERVRFRYTRMQRRYDEGMTVEVLRASPERVPPRCPHFGVCGGCSLQHLESGAQVRVKQETLADVFARIGRVQPERWLAPLTGTALARLLDIALQVDAHNTVVRHPDLGQIRRGHFLLAHHTQ